MSRKKNRKARRANEQLSKNKTALFESQILAELRDWLLPMLMNGQVRVK